MKPGDLVEVVISVYNTRGDFFCKGDIGVVFGPSESKISCMSVLINGILEDFVLDRLKII